MQTESTDSRPHPTKVKVVYQRDSDIGRLIDYKDARIAELEAEQSNLRGAMQAQDARERQAGEKCGVDYNLHGCDWPDAVADRIVELEAIVGKLPELLRKWWSFGSKQQHTHSWHTREDFLAELEKAVAGKPSLLDSTPQAAEAAR
jgi:hypothetical protein